MKTVFNTIHEGQYQTANLQINGFKKQKISFHLKMKKRDFLPSLFLSSSTKESITYKEKVVNRQNVDKLINWLI